MDLELSEDIRYFTNSEMGTYLRCKRKWWLAYYRRLRPAGGEEKTGVRALGTRIHSAMKWMYQPEDMRRNPLEVLLTEYEEDVQYLLHESGGVESEALTNLKKDYDLARIMIEGYIEWTLEEGIDTDLEIISSETPITAQIIPAGSLCDRPINLLGKLDVRARRNLDGARVFLDHKTVGSFSAATAGLAMDRQMLMYHLLEILEQVARGVPTEEAERCDGGLYNMIRRVKRTARAKPPFYQREFIRHNDQELRNFWTTIHGIITDILLTTQSLDNGVDHHMAAYPSPRGDCSWSCDFVHACHMFDDGSHVEVLLRDRFVSYDPVARYATDESDRAGEDE